MPAQVVKKIRRRPQRPARKQFCQRGKQRRLRFRLRRVGGFRRRFQLQRHRPQRAQINFARGQSRQFRYHFKMRRHHVMRQSRRQCPPQRLHFWPRVFRRHHKRHQLLALRQRTHHHRRRAHSGLRVQCRRDFIQFHAKPTNLHLVVRPPQTMHRPARLHARQIAGQIHQRLVRPRRHGIRHKPFRRQLRQPQIPQRQPRTEHTQFPHLSHRQWLPVVIHHQHPVIRQRPANRHRLPGFQFRQTRRHRRLRRPIRVEHRASGADQPLRQRIRARLAPQLISRTPGNGS